MITTAISQPRSHCAIIIIKCCNSYNINIITSLVMTCGKSTPEPLIVHTYMFDNQGIMDVHHLCIAIPA